MYVQNNGNRIPLNDMKSSIINEQDQRNRVVFSGWRRDIGV